MKWYAKSTVYQKVCLLKLPFEEENPVEDVSLKILLGHPKEGLYNSAEQ